MRDPRPDLIGFEARNRKDLKSLLLVAVTSLALALVADAAARLSPFAAVALPQDQRRAWVYVVLGYGVLVPLSMVLQRSSMQHLPLRQGGLPDRLFLLILALCLALPAFFFPESLLASGEGLIGRSGLVYRGMVSSLLSLALTGTILFYVAAAFVWLLLAAINHVFSVKRGGER
ncbi:hypothetical protein [Pseudoxanthomonas winnipegensis]|uniref:hypothetical protein n=1 Tax=Pseudoxanthomonas winnipegensis TaxID=2480810 RepID=UPI003F84ED91